MADLELSIDDKITPWLTKVATQYPKAAQGAVNGIAYDIRDAQRDRVEDRFEIRTQPNPMARTFMRNMVRVDKAKGASLEAKVVIRGPGVVPKKAQSAVLTRHEEGATVSPSPVIYAQDPDVRKGGLPRRLYPKALGLEARRDANASPYLGKGRGSLGGRRRGGKKLRANQGKLGTFSTPGGIFIRLGDRIERLWIKLRRPYRIQPRLGFIDLAEKTWQKRIEYQIRRALRQAGLY